MLNLLSIFTISFLIFIPSFAEDSSTAYISDFKSEILTTPRSCLERSKHTLLSADEVRQCDRWCNFDEQCSFFDFADNLCRNYQECLPSNQQPKRPLYAGGSLCEDGKDMDVLGSVFISLFEGSFLEHDTLNLFFQVPRYFTLTGVSFKDATHPTASYTPGSNTMYWSDFDYQCARIYKGAFPLWHVYDEARNRNELGLERNAEQGRLNGYLMIRAEQDVRFMDQIMKRNFEYSMPFALMDTTEISLHIMGQFEESDDVSPQFVDPNAPMELMFESGRQTSRLTQEGKLKSDIRIVGTSTLDGEIMEFAPVVNSTQDFEVTEQRLRILQECDDCGQAFSQKWELSFKANYVCRPETSFVAEIPILTSSGAVEKKLLTLDLAQSSACGKMSFCGNDFCPMLNIENGNEENVGVKTFVIGEIVDLSLTFEDNTDPTIIINDMDFTLRNGEKAVVHKAIGAGAEREWQNAVTTHEDSPSLTWSVFLDPDLPWIPGMSSVEIEITMFVSHRRRWLGIFEPFFRRFLSQTHTMTTSFSMNTHVCKVTRINDEITLSPGDHTLVTCDVGKTQWLTCHANLTVTETECEAPNLDVNDIASDTNVQEETNDNEILGMSLLIFILVLVTILIIIIAVCLVFGYCYYFKFGKSPTSPKRRPEQTYISKRTPAGFDPDDIGTHQPVVLKLTSVPIEEETKRSPYDFEATAADNMPPFQRNSESQPRPHNPV